MSLKACKDSKFVELRKSEVVEVLMKRELGIARCGLACCLCTEKADCNGCGSNGCPGNDICENKKCSITKGLTHCYECEENCRKGLVLCQDLVQVKMSFSHSNLPAIPKLPVDTIFQNHRVTYNRNDYEFVWYYKTFPSIQIPGGMHVCNC